MRSTGSRYAVQSGQTLCIVGESGSGKTVSSLTTLGLTQTQGAQVSGSIDVRGPRPAEWSAPTRCGRSAADDISMIFQDPLSSLHPFYKVGAQLTEAIRAHQKVSKAAARDRAVELLGLVKIPDPQRRVDQYPHEFSGGMRQRVMIAMALSNDPKLLIADEPTTALDVTVQAQIMSLLAELQERLGMAIILITHDLGVVAEIADIIAVMYAGRIVEHAPAEQIFAAPQHPYTWGLLKSIPRLDTPRDEALVPISGRPPSLIKRPGGCFFHPRCPYARESHTRIDPKREPVPGDPGHEVACLLEPDVRARIWKRLVAGDSPEVIRREVVGAAPAPVVAAEPAAEPAAETPGVEP